ncbi:MAG: hypothetical protein A3I44_05500 [Candidatus Sungbacteria bacterium RIFCSPLOWO2_02_FULL_51_17]|uniref:TrbC/VirB2 family protein n=1 Tax=Candidatus Sungbacteria bacterium RIFCSPHIGHO2_02_FULL_51_29 TaxID=1802273 RepID=A0A1G2KRQ2_9BACT|nr:MAG: hypothetical protein A2676_06065 [Candidatus Sungbacteria bacterium RIFCSPHIGHO2_01_FULL_51_22]OHA01964.1 MAG: hypothetical protein A3C16_02380 [Candidatus Sungbacteria bacterium RIFCSPHIGHO2_02_FULL_51_29]OHA05081.1 MAG: hypothetical protein A3B29_00365 [Candidatus Sungbacteria bacterium RIFCSPLOWO2_01_FULL_51_34]OHA11150.1 MAG: hypothetical protein A3I44_05500 [Candidatus Sungbacteria bacterium RIFCSPLOWO2_02_FULL_51_17]
MKKRILGGLVITWGAPLLVLASGISEPCDVVNLLNNLKGYFQDIVFILAIAAILYSGFLFLTAGGNEQTVTKAKTALVWGLIGIAVALFAGQAIEFMKSVVGGSSGAMCGTA